MHSDTLILLYLVYGLTFILFGGYALISHKKSFSVFPVVNALFYLGIFGVLHGLSEWFTMFRHANAFDHYRVELFYVGRILKALSFLALMQFGFVLLLKPFWRKVSARILGLYFFVFVIIFYRIVFLQGMGYLYENPMFLIVSLRYLMALPGGVMAMSVLFYQGFRIRKLDTLWAKHYFYLGTVIMIYGFLDGLFVRQANFFPANIFYNAWFNETLNIPIQFFKIITGGLIFIGIHLIIKSFAWERKRKWDAIQTDYKKHLSYDELNQKIHNDLIQNLYISGLNIDALKREINDHGCQNALEETSNVLNQNIQSLRAFLKNSTNKPLSLESFDQKVHSFIQSIHHTATFKLDYQNHLSLQGLRNIDAHVLEEMYYIIKEALMNALKHANASKVSVILYQELECIKLIITDNGKGFDLKKNRNVQHLGLKSMHKSAENLGGTLKVYSKEKSSWFKSGTTINAFIPLEGSS